MLHGLAGFFEATLYGNVGLSIHPARKAAISKDMLSWFPLFFPFKVSLSPPCPRCPSPRPDCAIQAPLYLPSNAELQVSIWRLTDSRKVWYEWYAEAFLPVLRPRPLSPPPRVDRQGSVVVATPAATAPFATPSPLLDPIDNPFLVVERPPAAAAAQRSLEDADVEAGVVKIGQTALHNPSGRSSWIGL